jgi:Tfp pilus assembly protein PilE
MSPRRHTKGFTLIEIAGIIIIIAILVALACAAYFRVISKSEDTEALTNLAAIRKAELSKHDESGTFVNATDTKDVNDQLPSPEIQDKIFRYKVVNATEENFIAIAERIKGGAAYKPIEIAMYADGGISQTYAPQGGPASGAGGGYTPDSGGYSGGSGGSGGGGDLGSGSGGSSGGGSGSGSGGSSGGSGGTGESGDTGGGTGGSGSGGAVSAFSEAPLAIGNDSFINLGWTAASNSPSYYNIYRSTSSLGSFDLIQGTWPAGATFYSDLGLTNDQTYYYRIDAVYGVGTFVSSSVFSSTPSSTSSYAQKSAAAFEALAASTNGLEVSGKISLYNVNIGFGSGVSGALAWYVPFFNTITINLEEFEKSQNVQASLLAHEGTHAWWNNDMTQGQPERGTNTEDSIDQEYNCFVNSANVWNEIKGSGTDPDMDGWASIMALGEAQAKEYIRLVYAGLPEY